MSGAFRRLLDAVDTIPAEVAALGEQARRFVDQQLSRGAFTPGCDSWHVGFDPRFSRALAERGWIGMTFPTRYGGGGRSAVARLAIVEQLIAAGTPLAAHWVGDRQVGASLLRHGTEAQRARLLPEIAAGRSFFALGMSEPDAGSDLASVRTKAARDGRHWRLTGTKVWSSHAHRCDYIVVLGRTEPRAESKHVGLTQFIVPCHAPGVTTRPIRQIGGVEHFNEVHFDGVRLTDDDVLGTVGAGWTQVTAELAYERSGPERFMSTYVLLSAADEAARRAGDEPARRAVATLFGRISALRILAYTVASQIDRGEVPMTLASIVKDMGTTLEWSSVHACSELAGRADIDSSLATLYRQAVALSPSFTLRGGTNEVLRTVIARGLSGD